MNHSGFGHHAGLPKKAKNAFNQPALDRLREMSQEPRYTNSAHYPRVFRRGMSSLSKATSEIRTVDEALALDAVGPFLAKTIAGVARKEHGMPEGNDGAASATTTTTGGKKRAAGRKRKAASASKAPTPPVQRQLTIIPPAAVGALAASTSTVSRAPALPARKRGRPARSASSGSTASSAADPAKPSAKQTAYARAVREGEGLSATLDQYGDWRVILLVDRRERKADHVRAKLLMSGIEAEVRQLPIGDMLWIARGVRKRITPNSGLGLGGAAERQQVEVVLGTVVERKTLEDLASSLFGTRFEEQRLRLKNSAAGANQVLYLVEAEEVNDLPNCSGATLRYAMMQTMVHLGFAIVRTKGLDDTVRYLKRVHRRLMRRSFPSEFCTAEFGADGREIPTFTSPDGRVRRADSAAAGGGAAGEELLFQNPPVPFEARRHTIYEEFKAKLELARESGTKSVKALHCAMLKQVDSWAIAKVHGLVSLYGTPASLARAYRDALARGGLDEADSMVQDVRIGKSLVTARRIGPKSSTELAKVFTAGVKEEDYCGEDNYAMKEGGDEQPLSLSPPKIAAAVGVAATAAASAAYQPSTDLLSNDDDDDAYERTPRRRNVDTSNGPSRDDDDESNDELNRKPAALSREELAAVRQGGAVNERSSSIQYDYEFSSDSDESDSSPGYKHSSQTTSAATSSRGALEQREVETASAAASKAKGDLRDCYDLTMDSSEEEDGGAIGITIPAAVSSSSNDGRNANRGSAITSTSTSNAASNVQGQRPTSSPRLSHDGVGDSDIEFSQKEASENSDSESSCDELVVRLRKRAIDNGGTARLYDTTGSVAESGRGQRQFFPSEDSDSSPEQPNRQQGRSMQPQAEADVEVIELLD